MSRALSQLCRYGAAVWRKEFALRLWYRVWLDDIPGRSAQLSYYFLLSLFPLLICLSALIGYLFTAEAGLDRRLLNYFGPMMPSAAFNIIKAVADDLLRTGGGGELSFGLLFSLWMASSGMEAAIEGLNVAFQVGEARPWWRRRLVALGLTVAVALLASGSVGIMVAGSWGGRTLTNLLGIANIWDPVWRGAQWIGSTLFLMTAITLVYYFGPNLKERQRSHVIIPGAAVALAGWILASFGMRLFLGQFSSLGRIYGSLGAVIALLLWLYLTGAAVLLGAEVNSGIQERLAHANSGGPAHHPRE